MSDQWGQQPPSEQQPPSWGQQSAPQQQPQWGEPGQMQQSPWVQQSDSNQPPWVQQPISPQLPNNSWGQQPLNPGQFQPQQSPPKKKRKRLWIILGIVGVLLFSCILCSVIGSFLPKTSATGNVSGTQSSIPVSIATKVAHIIQPTVRPTATAKPKPTATPKPTPTPVPTTTDAQIEATYKASTTNTTVINLDKNGNAYQGKDVHFTCKILGFVKDSTGNTSAANVTVSDSYSTSVVQVAFTSGTDITQLNEGDILEVWGNDDGVFSGTNAYGGPVQEVGVTASYMFDQTTNYQANN